MSARFLLAAAVASFLAPLLSAAPVEIIPPELRGAVQPQVAVTPSGRIHVAFGKDNAVFHTTSPDGRAFSAPVKIGELEKLALKMRRGPRVTATSDETKPSRRWLNGTVLGIGLASLFEQRVRAGVEKRMLIPVCLWDKFTFIERRRFC